MSEIQIVEVNDRLVEGLKSWLERQDSVFTVGDSESSLVICYSLFRELGGVNDELSRFITTDKNPKPTSLSGEIIELNGNFCFRIVGDHTSLAINEPTLNDLVFKLGDDLVISPSEIATLICKRGLEPVAVRDWLLRSTFSDFDPKKSSYRDELWVLRNNEVLQYAELVAQHKVIFQDMHDLTAHIAGLEKEGYGFAANMADKVLKKLRSYFGQRGRGNMPSHLIPFLMGIILDGLTQSMIYGSEPRRMAIEELLLAVDRVEFKPQEKLQLLGFPKGIDRINGLLQSRTRFSESILKSEIDLLVAECKSLSKDRPDFGG
jgi:hypothetical protein